MDLEKAPKPRRRGCERQAKERERAHTQVNWQGSRCKQDLHTHARIHQLKHTYLANNQVLPAVGVIHGWVNSHTEEVLMHGGLERTRGREQQAVRHRVYASTVQASQTTRQAA